MDLAAAAAARKEKVQNSLNHCGSIVTMNDIIARRVKNSKGNGEKVLEDSH
jgi:hypothetical protein